MTLPIELPAHDAYEWYVESWTGKYRKYNSRIQAEIAFRHESNLHKLCYIDYEGHSHVVKRRTRYGNLLSAVRAEDIGL